MLLGLGLFVFWYLVPTLHDLSTHDPSPPKYLSAEKLTALVNNWRVSQGLQPYIEEQRLCKIAAERVLVGDDDHEGFVKKYSNNLDYPTGVMQENAIWNFSSEQEGLDGWLNSPEHRAALEKPYKYSCIKTDKFNAIQIFSTF